MKVVCSHCHKQSISGTAGLRLCFPYRLVVFANRCFGFTISMQGGSSVGLCTAFVGQVCNDLFAFASFCLSVLAKSSLLFLISAVVGEVTTATMAATAKNTAPTTFISGFALPSVHHNKSPLL